MQCSLGRAIWWREEQEKGKKKQELGEGWMEQKRYSILSASPKKHPALLRLVYSCLEAPHLAAVTSIKLHLYISQFVLMDFLVLLSFGTKKGGYVCLTAKIMKEPKQ